MLSLNDALQIIKAHDYRDGNGTFKAVFMTCHREDQKGGELIELEHACGMGLPPNCKGHEMIGIRDMDTGKPYAIHNRLLFILNNQDIYWV